MSDGGATDIDHRSDDQPVSVPIPSSSPAAHPPPTHDLYYSPPASPPMTAYMPYYYYPHAPPPPGLGYPAAYYPLGGIPAHMHYPPAQGYDYDYEYEYQYQPPQQQPAQQHPPPQQSESTMLRAHSSDSISSLEGSSPTKRGEARATARISRSSRTKPAKELQDELKFDPDASVELLTRTTLMIRNIPNRYQAAEVMSLLKSVGLENSYDFLYVPLDFRNAANLGYAFINMLSPADTLTLHGKFNGKRWDDRNSKKVCEITYARVQGRTPLIEHFKDARFPGKAEAAAATTEEAKKFLPLVWNKKLTVSGKSVVDGPPLTIFEFIRMRDGERKGSDMAASYLRAFIEGVTDLPDEFQRHFSGLLTLDVRVNELQKELDADMLAQLKHMAQSGPPPTKKQKKEAKGGEADTGDPVLAKRIEANMNEIIHISEEKMKRAQQIYDLVDQHIRKLDKDLRSFGAEVSKERERLGVTAAHYPANNSNKAADPAKKKKKDAAKAPEVLYKEALAVADAGEPKYCTCNRISFGEMIACESDECPVEWFHFSCVGLTEANRPKGAWLCPDCQRKGGKK